MFAEDCSVVVYFSTATNRRLPGVSWSIFAPPFIYGESVVGWTVKWTVNENAGAESSQTGLLSTLLSILRSNPMVLDGRNRRTILVVERPKSFENR